MSLSNDGRTLLISSDGYEDGYIGVVRVYERQSQSWIQKGTDIDGEQAGDYSGYDASLSDDGDRLVVGSYSNDSNGASSGHARVFEFSDGDWVQVGLDIIGERAGDESGRGVSISGDGLIVAVGGYKNDDGGVDSGHVRVFRYLQDLTPSPTVTASPSETMTPAPSVFNQEWSQVGEDIYGERPYDQLGDKNTISLSKDGMVVAVGSQLNDDNGSNTGHVRIFRMTNDVWIKTGDDIEGAVGGDNFGCSLSLSANGKRVVIGALNNDDNGSNAGSVEVYEDVLGNWEQLGQTILGEAASDQFGQAVAISGNGKRIAVGAPYNDGGNGSNSGHLRVYEIMDGSMWVQQGRDIDGGGINHYLSGGGSISLSYDGYTVAAGSPWVDNGGSSSLDYGTVSFIDMSKRNQNLYL